MKVGIRKPSLKKSLSARNPATQFKRKYSVKKYVNPVKKRAYNRVYSKTTISIFDIIKSIFKLIK